MYGAHRIGLPQSPIEAVHAPRIRERADHGEVCPRPHSRGERADGRRRLLRVDAGAIGLGVPRVVDRPAVVSASSIFAYGNVKSKRVNRGEISVRHLKRAVSSSRSFGVLAIEIGVVAKTVALELLHRQAPRRAQTFDRAGGDEPTEPVS